MEISDMTFSTKDSAIPSYTTFTLSTEHDRKLIDVIFGRDALGICTHRSRKPKPEKVIFNGPATIVFWNDGTKTVTKCGEGDDFDPLFGIMACALRKTGKNHVRIDAWEPVIRFLADYLASAEECRVISDMLLSTADAMEVDGVMDEMDELDAPAQEDEAKADESKPASVVTDEDRERTRQTICDLFERGEL